MADVDIGFIDGVDEIDAAQWNACTGTDYPFTRHEFLLALEQAGATCAETGWLPQHLILREQEQLIGVMPLYLKSHSWGEYVFDWQWADAYRRNGLDYYPKLLAAIPFTPATGPRLCLCDPTRSDELAALVTQALQQRAVQQGASSAHILLPEAAVLPSFEAAGLLRRCTPQYHWHNRDYADFDAFLATFISRKRKTLRRERRIVREQDLELVRFSGAEMDPALWSVFYDFYQLTYAKRSGHGGYLTEDFFRRVAESMPEQLVVVMARHRGEWVGGALNFRSSDTLFGRYWGCSREFEFLHFEACYYQGIDYCIEHGLKRFDPGAQGEHKIARGFEPVPVWSLHWMRDHRFHEAIARFVEEEEQHIARYLREAAAQLPFRKDCVDNGAG